MYYSFKVEIPKGVSGINYKTLKGTTYVYYTYGRKYDPVRRYSIPANTSIGKRCNDDPMMMYPNPKFLEHFPNAGIPGAMQGDSVRSRVLKAGTFMVIRKIVSEYGLDEMLDRIIGKAAGLFLDFAAYSIITEDNAAQYYPDYAREHPLLTSGMKVYSDAKVSSFLSSLKREQGIEFLGEWNSKRDHRERIYISYDSTNKKCDIGDVSFVETGHAKDGLKLPVINYSVAYDTDNKEPLFYEDYPGSIVDISQLRYMLDKAAGYGYKRIGFILDRGYFSADNIRFMDKNGYQFIIMLKGKKDLVKDLVKKVRGTFEDDRRYRIRPYRVNGITVKGKLFVTDEKDRYFHIYFNPSAHAAEKEKIEKRFDRISDYFKKNEGRHVDFGDRYKEYYDLIYHNRGKEDACFMYARERTEAISELISLGGYFVIITSENMTASDAMHHYKGRDASEKLFRADKTFLGNGSLRTRTDGTTHAKIFVEFVALIIRNRIYTYLKDHMESTGKRDNYLTVPGAIRELEKIEMFKPLEGAYRLDHAVTKRQKEVLSAFGMDEDTVKKHAKRISEQLSMEV